MITIRRRITHLVLLLLLAAVASPAAPGLAQTSGPAAAQPGAGIRADFNQDGFADLAIGAPGEDVGTVELAGAVNVLYGTAGGLSGTGSQLFTQVGSIPEQGDRFGSGVAAGDFNQDGFADLAISAPDEDVSSIQGAGAVSVLYGSAEGLTATDGRLFIQVGGAVEAFDFFAWAVAAGDFNHDGFADLAAGAPEENFGDLLGAGAVSILYGSAGGVTTAGGQLFIQDSPGIPGISESLDGFGSALTTGGLGAVPAAASPPGSGPTTRLPTMTS